RKQVVDQNDLFAPRDGVDVQFHFRFAVLEGVFRTLGFVGQPAFFSQRHKTDPELVGHSLPEKESARIDSYNLVDSFALKPFQKKIDRRPKKCAVLQNRRDVFEDDAFLRKIRHVADAGAQPLDDVGIHRAMLAGTRLRSTPTSGCNYPRSIGLSTQEVILRYCFGHNVYVQLQIKPRTVAKKETKWASFSISNHIANIGMRF